MAHGLKLRYGEPRPPVAPDGGLHEHRVNPPHSGVPYAPDISLPSNFTGSTIHPPSVLFVQRVCRENRPYSVMATMRGTGSVSFFTDDRENRASLSKHRGVGPFQNPGGKIEGIGSLDL